MRTVTATEASRGFSDLLDAVEAGEAVTIMRGRRPVAELRPARRATGRDLAALFARSEPFDDEFVAEVLGARELVNRMPEDPWAEA